MVLHSLAPRELTPSDKCFLNYTGPYLFGLGTQVASLGDVDGDGFDDIVGLSERDGLDLTPGRAVGVSWRAQFWC